MDFLKNKPGTTILLSYVPKKEDMCCIVGYINRTEKRDSSAKSLYHWQIFRCRQLIFSEPEVIASPARGEDGRIYILMTSDYYKSSRLQLHLEKLNMTWGSPEPVSNMIYEVCFRYTLIARISPLWNQIDSYLIQGHDFLLSTSFMNSIKFEVIVRDEKMFLSLCPLRIRLTLIQKSDLEVKHDSDGKWVHVLPSMKKGCIMSVSSFIPDSCPFRTYKELRRHWKNMYGYRLPETPDKLFFCSLNFPSFTSTLYAYPSLCVRQQDIMFLQHTDHVTLLQTFVANVNSKLPVICGRPFNIESCAMHTVSKLCHWSESLGMANLSTLSETMRPARESEFLPHISQAEISRETCAVDSVAGGTKLLPPSCNSIINKDNLKKQEKLYPVFKRKTCPSTSSVMKVTQGPLSRTPVQSILSKDHISFIQLNKRAENKKARLPQRVQSDVDVEALARSHDLAHVNTATLISWLRAKNVSCKVKDRKSVLVEKVMNYLDLPL